MSRTKYNEANVPDGIRVRVRYARDANWTTFCYLIDKDDLIVAKGKAVCSLKDNPVRKIGRAIAVGRAIKSFRERMVR